jgi:hypothetical protein
MLEIVYDWQKNVERFLDAVQAAQGERFHDPAAGAFGSHVREGVGC